MPKKRSYKLNWLLIGGLAAAWYVWKSQAAKVVSGIAGAKYKKSAIKNLENYLLNNVIPMYGEKLITNSQKLNYLMNFFVENQAQNIKRMGVNGAFYNWIKSKPAVFQIAHYYGQIADIGYETGFLDPNKTTEKKEQKFEDNWYQLVSDVITDMWKINHMQKNGVQF
jgi:hypothetical protein